MKDFLIILALIVALSFVGFGLVSSVVIVAAGAGVMKTWSRPTFGRVMVAIVLAGWAATILIGFIEAFGICIVLLLAFSVRSAFS